MKSERIPVIPPCGSCLERIARGEDRIAVGGLEGSARAFLMALLFRHLRRPLIVIVPDGEGGGACFRDLSFFLGDGSGVSAALLGSADDGHVCLPAGDGARPPGGLPPPDVRRAGRRGDSRPRPDAEGHPAGGSRRLCGVDLRGRHPGAGRTGPEADRGGIRPRDARGGEGGVQRPGERRRSLSPDGPASVPSGVLRRRAGIDPRVRRGHPAFRQGTGRIHALPRPGGDPHPRAAGARRPQHPPPVQRTGAPPGNEGQSWPR